MGKNQVICLVIRGSSSMDPDASQVIPSQDLRLDGYVDVNNR